VLASLLRRAIGAQGSEAPAAALPEDGYASVVRSRQGTFIINAYDQGVGWQLRSYGAFDEVQMNLLARFASTAPRGSVILDIGANIGVASVVLARAAGPECRILAFEPQRHLFNMLAGNLALNAADSVVCRCEAVGARTGEASLPCLDYRSPASFGSVELNRAIQSDASQQAENGRHENVPMTSIDALGLAQVTLLKIDVEGMEAEVLAGGRSTISRDMPLMYVEFLKSDKAGLAATLNGLGYRLFEFHDNFVCIPARSEALSTLAAGLAPYIADAPHSQVS
jgi:FkbM family methyltransferase